MPEAPRPIGLLGGTFDPIHVGHLRLALEVRQRAALEAVLLLPAPRPRLRGTPTVDAETRLALVELAIDGVSGLRVDPRELARDGATRTVDTLEELRSEHGDRPLCWIMGADAATRLDEWHQWQRLTELAHLVIARRPGAKLPEHGEVARFIEARRAEDYRALGRAPAGRVHVCDIPGLDISSTGIRAMLAARQSIDFLVPEEVRRMLLNEGLYING